MRARQVAVLSLLAACMPAQAGPSFDCAKAQTPQEKLICSDAALSALDAQVGAAFSRLISAHPESAADFRASQRAWVKQQPDCAKDAKRAVNLTCMKKLYEDRLALLNSREFVVCGPARFTGAAFRLACAALNDPQKVSFVLDGRKTGDNDARLTKLSIAIAGGKPQEMKIDGRVWMDGLDTAIELVDVNFDGYDDVKLWTATSAGPNMGYAYWLYAPDKKQFTSTKLGDQLSGIDVVPDPKTRTIAVSGRSNCCSWNTSTYFWKGNALALRQSVDSGQMFVMDLPPAQPMPESMCGTETRHYNEAGLITRIDVALGAGAGDDFDCDQDVLDGQAGMLAALKAKPNGYRIEAKDKTHFTIVFDKPHKPGT